MEAMALSRVEGQVSTSEGQQQSTIPQYRAPLLHVINHRSKDSTAWQGQHRSPAAGATTETHVDLQHRMERSCSVYQGSNRSKKTTSGYAKGPSKKLFASLNRSCSFLKTKLLTRLA